MLPRFAETLLKQPTAATLQQGRDLAAALLAPALVVLVETMLLVLAATIVVVRAVSESASALKAALDECCRAGGALSESVSALKAAHCLAH